MKLKIFEEWYNEDIEEKINIFIENNTIVDIKVFIYEDMSGYPVKHYAVFYEEE